MQSLPSRRILARKLQPQTYIRENTLALLIYIREKRKLSHLDLYSRENFSHLDLCSRENFSHLDPHSLENINHLDLCSRENFSHLESRENFSSRTIRFYFARKLQPSRVAGKLQLTDDQVILLFWLYLVSRPVLQRPLLNEYQLIQFVQRSTA